MRQNESSNHGTVVPFSFETMWLHIKKSLTFTRSKPNDHCCCMWFCFQLVKSFANHISKTKLKICFWILSFWTCCFIKQNVMAEMSEACTHSAAAVAASYVLLWWEKGPAVERMWSKVVNHSFFVLPGDKINNNFLVLLPNLVVAHRIQFPKNTPEANKFFHLE